MYSVTVIEPGYGGRHPLLERPLMGQFPAA